MTFPSRRLAPVVQRVRARIGKHVILDDPQPRRPCARRRNHRGNAAHHRRPSSLVAQPGQPPSPPSFPA